jgi:hypothetical protein
MIFAQVNIDDELFENSDEEDSATEMVYSEFVEVMVRVAAEKLEHVLETSGSYAEIMVEFLGGRLKEAAGSAMPYAIMEEYSLLLAERETEGTRQKELRVANRAKKEAAAKAAMQLRDDELAGRGHSSPRAGDGGAGDEDDPDGYSAHRASVASLGDADAEDPDARHFSRLQRMSSTRQVPTLSCGATHAAAGEVQPLTARVLDAPARGAAARAALRRRRVRLRGLARVRRHSARAPPDRARNAAHAQAGSSLVHPLLHTKLYWH